MMSITPGPVPPPAPPAIVEVSSLPRWVGFAFVAAFALVGYLLYASYQQHQDLKRALDDSSHKNELLADELSKTNSRIAELRGEMDVTAQKLGLTQGELARAQALAQNLRKDQQTSDTQLRQQMGHMQEETATKIGQVSTDLSGTKSDVEATKKDLEATKSKLQTTVGDLGVQSGLIARNHDEVEELKRRGERNIYEFNLTKGKTPQHVGPIQITLRKVNAGKYQYTMDVIADDKKIEKKDRTAGEPIQFYVKGARAPYEIVVFTVTKDSASGYLSTPKDSGSAPSSAPAGSSSGSGAPNSQ
jgi:hypothetical protein